MIIIYECKYLLHMFAKNRIHKDNVFKFTSAQEIENDFD